MKTDSSENKLAGGSGNFLLLRLFFLLVALPVLLPTIGVFLQALIWRYILCRIDGINFVGGLLEAFALSLALTGCAACINLLVGAVTNLVKKLRHIPIEKSVKQKLPEVATWDDMYKAMPGFRSLFQQLLVYCAALACLSLLQPLRLHFDNFLSLLLASGVMSGSWIIYMTIMSAAIYALLILGQKSEAARTKEAI